MITVVTDSCSYFKEAEANALGIKIIPVNYFADGRAYLESYSDQNGEFEQLLKHGSKLSTSQPNPAAFLSCLEEETKKGNDVLCITMSSRLSGTYSAAHVAAKSVDKNNIAILDSRLIAGGLNLLVKKAVALINDGMELSEVIINLEQTREKISTVFSVADLSPLRKSGRGFAKMTANILNIKPVLRLKEGVVSFGGMARGNSNIIKELIKSISPNTEEVVINYIGSGTLSTNIYNVLQADYSGLPISLNKLGPVLGIHLGLDVVAVSHIVP
ncbi:MAG: DegV family protein [Defluviitaleaceae bacterium]|nr:DegV family protein [Defluviitaleaceae bacterium]